MNENAFRKHMFVHDVNASLCKHMLSEMASYIKKYVIQSKHEDM